MRRIGLIEIQAGGSWSVRIDDRFMPAGMYDLYLGDTPRAPQRESETFVEARERAQRALDAQEPREHGSGGMLDDEEAQRSRVESEPKPPEWWRKLTERWRRRNERERDK
jgi:hypothetical protein